MFYKPKLKLLFNSEVSYSQTGNGRFYYQLISRIHATGKYRCSELGSFGEIGNPLDHIVKWKLYCNHLSNDKDPRFAQFNSNEQNKLGAFRFDKTLLDFQPDIIIDARDSTFFEFVNLSPLRPYFHFITHPTLDSVPQHNSWISTNLNADLVIPYSDYAKECWQKEGGGKIKLGPVIYPGVNFDDFHPLKNKDQLRQVNNLSPQNNIMGFVGRNQIRKLIPQMLTGFKQYLDTLDNQASRNNNYFLLQTTYPDLRSWDISKLLIELNIANNVLFCYTCTKCLRYSVEKWKDINNICKYCGGQSILPRVNFGPTPAQLNELYNIMDLYVHLANAGACEIPIIEAAGAGTCVMAIDFAGMRSVVKRLEAIPIKVKITARDINVNADRALADLDDFVEKLHAFFKRPKQINLRNGYKLHENCKKRFNWDDAARLYMEYFDNYTPTGLQSQWHNNKVYQPQQVNENQPTANFISDLVKLGLQEPSLEHSFFIDDSIRHAELGIRSNGNGVINFNRENLKQTVINFINNKIATDRVRRGEIKLENEDFFSYSEIKELANL